MLWLTALLGLSGAGYGYWRYQRTHQPPPVTFQTAAVEKRAIIGRVTATGTLQARVTVQVGSQVSGRIQRLNADYNSTVKKGEVIAKIDPTLFEAALAREQANNLSAKADLERTKAQAMLADKKLARLKSLGAEQLATQADIDTAETDAIVARAQIKAAEAALQQNLAALRSATTNLSFTTIVSPIDGTVISRSVDVGQTVAASLQAPTIFTIAEDLRKMQVATSVSESDVGRLSSGMKATFTVDAYPGQTFVGSIAQIRNAAQTVQNVVTYLAIIEFDNPELKLRPGMTASVNITYAERPEALAVPNAALRFNPPPEANLKVPEKPGRPRPDGPPRPDTSATIAGASASGQRDDLGPRPEPSASGFVQNTANVGLPSQGGHRGGRQGVGEWKTLWIPKGTSAEAVTVRIGLSDGTFTEVLGNKLSPGDLVVIDSTVTGRTGGGSAGPGANASKSGGARPPGGMGRMF